jgi:alpha-methylacyl-CoA racemase
VERELSGLGQVVDAAMVDGVATLSQMLWSLRAQGEWTDRRGTNLLDGGAPHYGVYLCADGRYVAVGALESPFYRALLKGLDLSPEELPDHRVRANWPQLRRLFAEVFGRHPRDHWAALFEGTDACVTPVLAPDEAVRHPHIAARATLAERDGAVQAAPAPRFSRTPAGTPVPAVAADPAAVLRDWTAPS